MQRIIIFVLMLLVLSPVNREARAASLHEAVQKGNQLVREGKFDDALKTYVDGQIEHSDDPRLKYNIAATQYKMKNYEEAVKGFLDTAATSKDVKLEEQALYNCGNALYRQGKLEEAIEYYKKALGLNPDDRDAKHNLEFVQEELKKRINEAQETTQKQEQNNQQQQNQEQQQSQQKQQQNQAQQEDQNKQQQQPQQQKEQKQEEQKSAGQEEKKQEPQLGEQQQEQQGAQQQQRARAEKKENKSDETQSTPTQARQMTKEEAEQWLSSIEENREKFAKKKEQEGHAGQYRPEKDW